MKRDKLDLSVLKVKSFTTSEVKRTKAGGYESQFPSACDSEVRCQTIHYTVCYGGNQCKKY